MEVGFVIRKLAVYIFNVDKAGDSIIQKQLEEFVSTIEGTEAFVEEAKDNSIVITAECSEGVRCNPVEAIVDRIRSLKTTLELFEDEEHCDIALAFADSCTEVYVCWNHRKIWEIDTTYIGSQLDNPPKTCKECKLLIEKAKEAKEKAERDEDLKNGVCYEIR